MASTDAGASERTGRKELNLHQQRVRAAYTFLIPMLVMLAIVAAWPLFRSISFSFTDASADTIFNGQSEWVGFENYLERRERADGSVRWRGVLVKRQMASSEQMIAKL